MKEALLEHIPSLRAFARSLCRDPALSDDLVQDTLMRAWANRERFVEGSNLRAWLFTILRNRFYSHMRKQGREVADPEGTVAGNAPSAGNQEDRIVLGDFRRAFMTLPAEQREALTLVGGSGCSYEEAAEICECAVGTIKSRVSRARLRLTELLEGELGPGVRPEIGAEDLQSFLSEVDTQS